jgi:peptide/nickel transport system substrate-binding protein
VFRRNPYFWQKDAQGNALPYIDRVIWQIVESLDTDLLKFRSGDLDILGGMSTIRPEDFSILKREEKRGKFQIQFGGPRSGTLFLCFNLNQGKRQGKPLVDPIKSRWFNTKEFRQAVAYAIDRQSMIDRVYRGLARTQNSPISVQSPFYLSPEAGLKVYDYDPDKAKALLQGAGFKYNGNQLLDAEGNSVRFTMITNAGNKLREALGTQIKQDLAAIGIQVDFTPIAFNTLVDKLDNSLDWDSFILGFTGGIEPNAGFNLWNPDGGSHFFNQKPQAGGEPLEGRVVSDWELRIKQLYVQAAQALDEPKRKQLYAETQRITQEHLPVIYLVNPESMAAVRDRIQNVRYSAIGGTYWNLPEQKVAQ